MKKAIKILLVSFVLVTLQSCIVCRLERDYEPVDSPAIETNDMENKIIPELN